MNSSVNPNKFNKTELSQNLANLCNRFTKSFSDIKEMKSARN